MPTIANPGDDRRNDPSAPLEIVAFEKGIYKGAFAGFDRSDNRHPDNFFNDLFPNPFTRFFPITKIVVSHARNRPGLPELLHDFVVRIQQSVFNCVV